MRKFLEEDKGPFSERSINEMATVCKNSKIRIDVYSQDHAPAHAHLSTGDGKKVCRFYVSVSCPRNVSDVQIFKGDKVSEDKKHLLSEVVAWAKSSQDGVSNWKVLSIAWNILHPK